MTFDEVIPRTIPHLLRSADWLRQELRDRYAAVICDEYQDTGQPAADFIEELAVGPRLICLADPDQVIFDFTDDTITRRVLDYQASGAVEYDLGYDSRRDPSNVIPRAAAGIRRREFGDPAIEEACRGRRLRVLKYGPADEPFNVLVQEILSLSLLVLAMSASSLPPIGASMTLPSDFARRISTTRSSVSQVLRATLKRRTLCRRCSVCSLRTGQRHHPRSDLGVGRLHSSEPPALAFGLVQGLRGLEPGLVRTLDAEREAFEALAGRPFEDFLDHATSFWARLFTGRPRQLWSKGSETYGARP